MPSNIEEDPTNNREVDQPGSHHEVEDQNMETTVNADGIAYTIHNITDYGIEYLS